MKLLRQIYLLVLVMLFSHSLAFAAKPEFRAAWVTAWAEGILAPHQADETIQAAKEANLNALFVQVRKTGDAYYNSSLEPRGTDIASMPEYDPLAYLVQKGHEAGLEVHAWVVVFRVWSGKSFPLDPGHVFNQHPDWLSKDFSGSINSHDGIWLDPGNVEVRDYTINVFKDIVSKYDIDGLHLDYIRYPGSDWGYNEAAVAQFNQAFGRSGRPAPSDSTWSDWRRRQVTETVRRIYREVTRLRPELKVTASTIPWGDCSRDFTKASPYIKALQDWRTWMKEGILDANVIMNYKDETKSSGARSFRSWINGARRWQYGRHAYIGQNFNEDTQSVVQQIQASRKRGMQGISGFYFNATPWRPKLVQALRSQVFEEAASIPAMPWKEDAVKRASRKAFARAVSLAVKDENLDEAIELLSRSIKLNPTYVDAHFRLGRCYLRKEMYEQAAAKFQEVLLMDPEYKAAEEELAMAKRQIAEAVEDPLAASPQSNP